MTSSKGILVLGVGMECDVSSVFGGVGSVWSGCDCVEMDVACVMGVAAAGGGGGIRLALVSNRLRVTGDFEDCVTGCGGV